MRNLHLLSDSDLLSKTQDCVREERRAVTELGYSECAAYRRVNAMRVLQDVPQFEQVIGKSQRETDHLLATLAPQTFKKERARPLSEDLTELRIALTKNQMAVLEKARAKFSHLAKGWAELLEVLAGDAIKDPKPRTFLSLITSSRTLLAARPQVRI